MNNLSMETVFLALSGVILMAGVLYWFWSHIQLTQKKVQLLENAVFELRGMLQRGDGGHESNGGVEGNQGTGNQGTGNQGTGNPGVPLPPSPPKTLRSDSDSSASIYNDLSDDDWKEVEGNNEGSNENNAIDLSAGSTPLSELGIDLDHDLNHESHRVEEVEVHPDLQPGGRIEAVEPKTEQFRDLFTAPPTEATSLDAMPVKDLRRLAEQRGIPNVSELRKKEILSALKSQVIPSSSSSSSSSGSVVVEKTLDLTEMVNAEILE